MRFNLLVALACVVSATVPSAQTDPVLKVTQRAQSIDLFTYSPEAGVLVKREMDPQTVLCIEHQPSPTIRWSNQYFLTAPAQDSIVGTNVGVAPKQVEVPPAPKLPERTCHTVADWLGKGR